MAAILQKLEVFTQMSAERSNAYLEQENQRVSQIIAQMLHVESSLRERNLKLRSEHHDLMVLLRTLTNVNEEHTDPVTGGYSDNTTGMMTEKLAAGHHAMLESLNLSYDSLETKMPGSQPQPNPGVPAPEDAEIEAVTVAVENFVRSQGAQGLLPAVGKASASLTPEVRPQWTVPPAHDQKKKSSGDETLARFLL